MSRGRFPGGSDQLLPHETDAQGFQIENRRDSRVVYAACTMCTFACGCDVVPQPHHTQVRFPFRADYFSDRFRGFRTETHTAKTNVGAAYEGCVAWLCLYVDRHKGKYADRSGFTGVHSRKR